MAHLPLVVRSRVLLPRQRLKIRLHDTRAAAALEGHEVFAAVFSPRPGERSTVGVAARITTRQPVSHNRLDVAVIGEKRFLLLAGTDTGDSAEVEYLDEPAGEGDVEFLRSELERGWQRFAAAAAESGESAAIHARLHADPVIASYQAATLLPLLHAERQELLEIRSTSERLERLLRIVAGETGVLRHLLGMGRMGA
jgi:Lon protease-like protein